MRDSLIKATVTSLKTYRMNSFADGEHGNRNAPTLSLSRWMNCIFVCRNCGQTIRQHSPAIYWHYLGNFEVASLLKSVQKGFKSLNMLTGLENGWQ